MGYHGFIDDIPILLVKLSFLLVKPPISASTTTFFSGFSPRIVACALKKKKRPGYVNVTWRSEAESSGIISPGNTSFNELKMVQLNIPGLVMSSYSY